MNAPTASDVARTSALAELSERLMRTIAPAEGQESLLPAEPHTLLSVLVEWQQKGYAIGEPYRAYPSAKLGHEDWRIQITRPDGIELTLGFFIRIEPIPTKRK